MNNTDILYDTDDQKNATSRVLAVVRVKSINKSVDELIADIINYANEIDKILEANKLNKRYLDLLSTIDVNITFSVSLDEDLKDLDFRILEDIENYIKRINTRIELIQNNTKLVNELESTYQLKDYNFETDILTAKLRKEDFVNI